MSKFYGFDEALDQITEDQRVVRRIRDTFSCFLTIEGAINALRPIEVEWLLIGCLRINAKKPNTIDKETINRIKEKIWRITRYE